MSDRQTFGKRKYLLLVIPVLLLLGWFAFAPGNDQKTDDTKNTKTSQKQQDRKDSNDKQKDSTEGQVEAASTTEPSSNTTTNTTSPTWKPSPSVKVASVVTGNPTTPPQQQPLPQDPQTPPTDDEETPPNEEPLCVAYDGQIIQLAADELSDCYTLTRPDNAATCWTPWTYLVVTEDGATLVTLDEKPVEGKPYIVIENANVFNPDDEETYGCPVYGTSLQFRVYAPEDVQPQEQPVVSYDYQLNVDSVDPLWDPSNPDEGTQPIQAAVNVDIVEDETPADPAL